MKPIDLRSDTVTQPVAKMRHLIASAEVGDDVYGEDPTVNKLEALAAKILGAEAALFVGSGTQSNLLALLSHCQRGDEYIVGQNAHTYKYEGGGAAMFGSIQPQPLDFEPDGTLDLTKVKSVIKPDDFHFARTKLLCLENTQAGNVLPLEYLKSARDFTLKHGLKLHLDGARIFNAAVKLNVPTQEIAKHFDSVSICLSKGLGAPVGSVLCGSEDFIKTARRWRKPLGGGMRQAGMLAAAGIYALEHHITRLAEDHANAEILAQGLEQIAEIRVHREIAPTNMVFIDVEEQTANLLAQFLKPKGILISAHSPIRMVTHLDVNESDILFVIKAVEEFLCRIE